MNTQARSVWVLRSSPRVWSESEMTVDVPQQRHADTLTLDRYIPPLAPNASFSTLTQTLLSSSIFLSLLSTNGSHGPLPQHCQQRHGKSGTPIYYSCISPHDPSIVLCFLSPLLSETPTTLFRLLMAMGLRREVVLSFWTGSGL